MLPGNHLLRKIIFVCRPEFAERLLQALKGAGWSERDCQQRLRIKLFRYYSSEAKFILKNPTL